MNIFTFIKSRVSIADVVGSYTTLKKSGHYLKASCPFHTEKTGSFTVSPHKEIFYCFGCHESGDAITFVSKMEHCSLVDAAKILADRYRIELPATLSYEDATKEKKRYYDICAHISIWCHEQLKKNRLALEYLEKRNINTKSIHDFMIGYFPGGLSATKSLIHDMAKHAILIDDLIQAHVLIQGKNILYSPFEERIIFPIKDYMARHVGFGGRIFKAEDTRPKYYNSRENEFFSKGSLLFGVDIAKKEIQKQESVFLVEGYTDCIAMVQHGYGNTVATLGTACTSEHLTLLARYASSVYVVYDGDKAGQQAMLRMAQLCWQATLDLQVISLPPSEDPASYLAKNNNLISLLERAQDIFIFFINTLSSNFSSKGLSEKLALTRKIIETIQTLNDPIKQDLLLKRASQALDIPFDSLRSYIGPKQPVLVQPHKPANPDIEVKSPINTSLPKLEKKIFLAIMNNIQLLHRGNAWYLITFLPQPLRDITAVLHQKKEESPSLDFIQFFDALDEQHKQFISRIIVEEPPIQEEKAFDRLLAQLQKNHWKVIVNNIKLKIEQAKQAGNESQVQQLVNEFLQLRQTIIGKDTIQTKD